MALKHLLCLLLLACAAPCRAQQDAPQPAPQNARAEELTEVRDRLMVSLFFRGELADRIMDAGMAGRFVDLEELETNSDVRLALLGWIKKNPREAAELYLHLRGGGAASGQLPAYKSVWELNAGFLALVKNLNAAAGNKAVSGETLELAARRLYEGPQAAADEAPVTGGGQASGTGFFAGEYADYKLNRAGLEKELAVAGRWLDAVRGPAGRGPAGLERNFSAALAQYAAFVAAAASVKGRQVVSGAESAALEAGRYKLRGALAALALRSRAQELAAITAQLAQAQGEPGAKDLLARLLDFKAALEGAAGRIEGGRFIFAGLNLQLQAFEKEFFALYLRYSAYNGLLDLKRRAAGLGFSCFYDYAAYRVLKELFPAAAYPRARLALAGAQGALDPALAALAAGDVAGAAALLGGGADALAGAAALAQKASAQNRAVQFFQWGVFFRPVEYDLRARRPAFTFIELLKK
ncbi:MAG: hypothetical protein NDI60_05245 [Elusimicrobiales bacterium]|nr:hypothetical protein [Elusimicrobiales bacterium]